MLQNYGQVIVKVDHLNSIAFVVMTHLPARSLILLCLTWASLPLLAEQSHYIGQKACAGCHAEQSAEWTGSHHDLAMQEATEQSVAANFDNTTFEIHGVTSRFFRKDGQFMVHTDGPDGKMHEYAIKYTFGVYPLQQYLVEFPGGRLQALDIAWDSRSSDQGGQRWFHLHPEDKVDHDDVLHWTGPNLNWNYMCADCHSTNLKKNYRSDNNSYETRWSELDVSCEACHGPGSTHQAWADATAAGKEPHISNKGLTVALDERNGIAWTIDPETGKPIRSKSKNSHRELDVCARCHSRRSQLTDEVIPGDSFLNSYRPALLTESLYFPDGQMKDEVYVWGSFMQSKMHQSGVTCSDCHNPHTAELRLPGEKVCYQCHAADRYASQAHHFHQPDSKGASCIECHMPATTFMGVDDRNDHSFRVPRPDWSASLGTPNACNSCHQQESAAWAAQHTKRWYGKQPEGFHRFAPILAAAQDASITAQQRLMELALNTNQPVIARATAYSELAAPSSQQALMVLQQGLNDEQPLVRLGALNALVGAPLRYRLLAFPLVWDEQRSVRIEAARLMASYPKEQFKPEQIDVLEKVIREYIEVQQFSAERPESQLNLAGLYADMERFEEAETAYRQALKLQNRFVPAYINFAQMLSNRGREREADNLLRAGISKVPDNAILHHALGLSLVRQKQLNGAIESLKRANELAPDNTRYAYVYAVALQTTGNLSGAIRILEHALEQHPEDPDLLFTLVTFNRDAGNKSAALHYAEKLQELIPDNPDIAQLVRQLQDNN